MQTASAVPVTMISPCPHSSSFGGVQRSALAAWNGLPDTARLVCYGTDCALPARHDARNQRCCRTKGRAALAVAASTRGARTILVWHLGLLKLLPFAWCGEARIFLYLHGIECWRPLDLLTRRLLRRVDVFLANSAFTWERFTQRNPGFRDAACRVVPLGAEAPCEDAGEPAEPPAALIAGRMDRREDYKGHRELIRAWPLLLRRAPDAQLWVVGSGDLAADLQTLAGGLARTGHIRFLGAVSDEEKSRLMGECTCFAMPSHGEGFGLVYLEAMRAGRPCLVGSADAGREVVNPPEAGLAVDPADQDALLEALARLLRRDGAWREWSLRARKRYERHFTEEAFRRRLLSALAE